ncbi:MAG: PAS domain S-box protein [Acidobacteriota bacterium]|nr:PAS domain S-box protein [Acidobacteriota bacterium]
MKRNRDGPAERGAIRVLLVGEVGSVAELRKELERGGYEPFARQVDSEEGLSEALDDWTWDVAICEDGTGAFGGPAALRLIKRKRSDLPVIVVSSLFGETIAAAAMKAGADDFIARGYLARLVPAVEREVGAARARRGWDEAAHGLIEIQSRSDAFMNNSPTVAFMKDESGRLVYVNRGFEDVFHTRLDDVLGKNDEELFGAETAAEVRENDLAVLAEDRPMQFEEHVAAPDGERSWLVSKFPFSDASGMRFVGGVAVDITERKKAETALRVSEDLFRDLMEHSHALICIHDLEGTILTANSAAERNLGYQTTADFARNVRRLQDFLAPGAEQAFDQYLLEIAQTGVASGMMSVTTRTGERRYWEYRNTMRTEGVDKPVVRAVAIDVTDRFVAERSLRDAQRFSEEIIASAGEGIIVYGPDLRYLLWNPFMEEVTGLSAGDVLGRTPEEIFPDCSTNGVLDSLKRALAGEKVSTHDLALSIASTGRSARVSCTYTPHRNADGNVVGVIEIVENVTERKRAEETLRESQASLERAQEVGRIGSWVSGLEEDSLSWSKETCRIFGVDPAKFDGRLSTFFERVHPADRDAVETAVREALDSDRTYRIEHRVLRGDGSEVWVYERADVVRDASGKAVRLEGIVQDITERRRLEEQFLQAQKMEAIGRLAGGVAHDFNNLLTAILGYTDLLLQQVGPADAMRDDLEQIQIAGDRAAALTRQLLAFSRRQMLEPKVIDVNVTIRHLEKMLRRVLGEDVLLVTSLDADLELVRADPGQLEQVIVNLVVNSRDSMPSGGTITISTRSAMLDDALDLGRFAIAPGVYVVLEVLDTGTGMDATTLARIFEPFFTTKEKGKGTGLGLATAYGIVKQSGGYIACDSEPGQGTRFQIYLPRSFERAEEGNAGQGGDRDSLRGSETVLLVEDEDGVRLLSRRLLEAHGYHVLEASGGEQALEFAARYPDPIHLLLTDVVMPVMSGPEVARQIQGLRPKIKILFMTGYSDSTVTGLAPDAPLLQKPFTPDALAHRVRETLAS